jgi:hypothetical protein
MRAHAVADAQPRAGRSARPDFGKGVAGQVFRLAVRAVHVVFDADAAVGRNSSMRPQSMQSAWPAFFTSSSSMSMK